VTFQYNQGTSHSQTSGLGIGVSGYGVDAGYDGSGTNASTATRTEGYAHHKGNAAFRTLFKVGQFRGLCIGPQGVPIHHQKQHGKCPSTYKNDLGQMYWVHKCFWMVASIGWFGGTSTTVPSKAPATPSVNCAPHEPNSNYNGDLGTAEQWSAGFELGLSTGIKGVKLKASFNSSAQTGYDVNARMYFHFGSHGGHLCGTNASESSAAVLVERR